MNSNLKNYELIGNLAESKVIDQLNKLPAPWHHFSAVEWRHIKHNKEQIGEADAVVFHPQYGLIVFEIKAGAVYIKDGDWFYASGRPMAQSPCQQARRNRYALMEKLIPKIGEEASKNLTITHAVFFPDTVWKGDIPTELPSKAFLLDRTHLNDLEASLIRILKSVHPQPTIWTKAQIQALEQIFAPTVVTFEPLVIQLEQTGQALHHATRQQLNALRMLGSQKRLLINGIAGSGKTHLALTLAKQHAKQGKRVLMTCYNHVLANQLKYLTEDQPNIEAISFHDLVEKLTKQAGLSYNPPKEKEALQYFYAEGTTQLLFDALEHIDVAYDTIIIDEAADFKAIWWDAIEMLGAEDFSWYCFYDLQQSLYLEQHDWQPPFAANVMPLTDNLRNTQPIGLTAAKYGQCPPAENYLVKEGLEPVWYHHDNFDEMADQLRDLLKQLIEKDLVPAEKIVILSPYRHTNEQSTWSAGLNKVKINTEMTVFKTGQVRVGTIHSFKGLEASVVILAGMTPRALANHKLFYVGATRAKAALYILALNSKNQED